MLRRIVALLALALIIIGCAKKSTAYQENHILKQIRQIPLVGDPTDLDLGSNSLYVAEDQGGFSIINMSNYTKRWFTTMPATDGSSVNLIKIRKISVVEPRNRLFISETDGTDLIRIINTADPDTLKVMDAITGATQDIQDMRFINIPNPIDQFTIEGFFCNGRELRYGKYDGVANMWFGITLTITTSATARGFDVDSQYIYIAVDQRGLEIYNRSNGALVGAIDLPGEAQKVKVVGNYAYLACRQEGLQVVNVSNPAAPVKVSSYNTSGYATRLDIWNNYLALSSGGGGVYLFDITNPNNIVKKDQVIDCGYANAVKFYQGKLIVAGRDKGILIYSLN